MTTLLVQASDTSERRKTQFSWTNHSNEVTDIYNTPQGSCGRLATVSLDTTCRLYELNTGSLLTTVCLDVALSAVTMDTLECFIFCGDIFGELHCINIYEGLQREIHANEPVNKKIKIHEQKIVNLEVNFDGSLLLTASEDCIKVFMLDSFSLMTRIDEENCCGGITNAMFVSIPLEALMDEKYIPISKIGRLRRNLEESREDKPLTCTRVSARPPKVKAHYMEDTSILSHYIPCKYVIMEKLAEQNERSFQKQPTVFLNKKPGLGKQKLKKGRYTKNVGLGFKTPREATEEMG
ncbi:hypothetical protein JTE90_017398 [Oedothorax gibbosus]|uniref:Small ribosomal subunit protein uS17 N-terminal domain-containing protein n=1 Tax=Oedothorax gibbosus TaxID=931172 RepID=A0AAV6TS67_9ARAC|nr:hypothetical protein JTE90_017398 [Oedothorax gibbosus]